MDFQRNHWIIIGLIAFNALLFGSMAINSGFPSSENEIAMNNAAIDEVMRKVKAGFEAGDDTYTIEIMYLPVVEMLGGREAVLMASKTVREKMQSMNIEVLSWSVTKPYRYVTTDSRKYALIPYDSTMTMNGRRIHSYGYQLGIKEDGRGWEFISGDVMNNQLYTQLFPDFPQGVDLPLVSTSFN